MHHIEIAIKASQAARKANGAERQAWRELSRVLICGDMQRARSVLSILRRFNVPPRETVSRLAGELDAVLSHAHNPKENIGN